MKLKALDQIHVSSVRSTAMRPGEEFETSEWEGKQLVQRGLAAPVKAKPNAATKPKPKGKRATAAANKAAPTPANKSEGGSAAPVAPPAE